MKYFVFLIGLVSVLAVSCSTDPVFSIVPEIEYVDIQPREAIENVDSILITISFTDGDGDLGDLPNSGTQSITIRDNRVLPDGSLLPDSLAISRFSIPDLSSNARNPSIQGKIFITLSPTLVFPRNLSEQQVPFSVFIQDRSEHQSNVIQTEPILLKKQ
jgi:hypothetical protein